MRGSRVCLGFVLVTGLVAARPVRAAVPPDGAPAPITAAAPTVAPRPLRNAAPAPRRGAWIAAGATLHGAFHFGTLVAMLLSSGFSLDYGPVAAVPVFGPLIVGVAVLTPATPAGWGWFGRPFFAAAFMLDGIVQGVGLGLLIAGAASVARAASSGSSAGPPTRPLLAWALAPGAGGTPMGATFTLTW
jgi:hypothetical protein